MFVPRCSFLWPDHFETVILTRTLAHTSTPRRSTFVVIVHRSYKQYKARIRTRWNETNTHTTVPAAQFATRASNERTKQKKITKSERPPSPPNPQTTVVHCWCYIRDYIEGCWMWFHSIGSCVFCSLVSKFPSPWGLEHPNEIWSAPVVNEHGHCPGCTINLVMNQHTFTHMHAIIVGSNLMGHQLNSFHRPAGGWDGHSEYGREDERTNPTTTTLSISTPLAHKKERKRQQ